MAYTKQELIDWITEELPDDAVVAFVATEVGEESLIDDMLMSFGDVLDETGLDEEDIRGFNLEDEKTSHIVFLA